MHEGKLSHITPPDNLKKKTKIKIKKIMLNYDEEIVLGFRTPGEGWKPTPLVTVIEFKEEEGNPIRIGNATSNTLKYPAFNYVYVDGRKVEEFPANRILRGNKKLLEEGKYEATIKRIGAASIKKDELITNIKGKTFICIASEELQGRDGKYNRNTFALKAEYEKLHPTAGGNDDL